MVRGAATLPRTGRANRADCPVEPAGPAPLACACFFVSHARLRLEQACRVHPRPPRLREVRGPRVPDRLGPRLHRAPDPLPQGLPSRRVWRHGRVPGGEVRDESGDGSAGIDDGSLKKPWNTVAFHCLSAGSSLISILRKTVAKSLFSCRRTKWP